MNVEINSNQISTKKRIVSVQITESLYDTLKREADNKMLSVSDLIRISLYNNFNRKEN